MMNIINYFYTMRKRVNDKTLLKLQKMINEEVDRRLINDKNNTINRE